jgi:hypothetical protein
LKFFVAGPRIDPPCIDGNVISRSPFGPIWIALARRKAAAGRRKRARDASGETRDVENRQERAPAVRCRLEWSTVMVHSAPRRPPRLEQKALQAKGF